MKKSLVLLVVIVATLAFVGTTFAMNCGLPPICEELYLTKSKPWAGKWKKPAAAKPAPPKCVTVKGCGPCPVSYTIPGGPYAVAPGLENIKVTKTVDVMRDWCVGKAKGKTQLCGPCAPTIAWSGSWKTSEIIGKTKVDYVLPPAYRWCGEDACPPPTPVGVKAVPKPVTPPECF